MRCSVSFPSHDLQRALQFIVQPPSLLVEHRVNEARGTGQGDFCCQDRHGAVRGDLPQATKGVVDLASSGHLCSLQARKKVLKWGVLKSWSCPIPCSPSLFVPLHLISCGFWIQHLDKMLQICHFAAGLSNVPSPHNSTSSGYLHKGSTSHGEMLFLPILLLFWILHEWGLCCQPINCHKVNGLVLQATGLNFWEWDLLQTITWGYCDNLAEV